MKYRIIKIAFLLVLLVHLSSCFGHREKNKIRHRTYKAHYRKAGRFW